MTNTIDSVLQALFTQVDEDTLVLTPNKRLSRYLHRQYAQCQNQQGYSAWHSLACLSFAGWVQQLWDAWLFSSEFLAETESSVPDFILSPTQEILIWQEIIQQYCDAHNELELFNASATTRVAKAAWQTLVEWQIHIDDLAQSHVTQETEVFVQWARRFHESCEAYKAIDSASQLNLIKQAIANKKLSLPKKIVLVAFDELSPLAQSLFQQAKAQGTELQYLELQLGDVDSVSHLGLSDETQEILAAAKWAAQKIQQNPSASVGIVIPDLANSRDKVETIFRQVFEPQYSFPQQPRHAGGFNMSAAQVLANTPPIAAALLALKLNLHELDIEDVSLILHSPFLGSFNELPARALFNAKLRKNYLRVALSSLRASASHFGVKTSSLKKKVNAEMDCEVEGENKEETTLVADFYSRLQQLHTENMHLPNQQAPSAWAVVFIQQLQTLGWPGQRSLDTLEYQQVNVWQDVIKEFCALDSICNSLTLREAIQYLTQLAQNTQFQAQTTTSPVQILGVLEAAGMLFDHLWVMNLDNDHWPPAPSPNALLPIRLQKELKMPRASAEKELALSERLTARFAASARQVIFSYAQRDGDKILAPSALIGKYPVCELALLDASNEHSYTTSLFQLSRLETLIDAKAEKVTVTAALKGGTQILKDQAACPFRSFAKHRLAALENEDAVAGLSAADRGSLIHNALETVWKKMGTQQKLLSLTEEQLTEELQSAIQQSFYRLPKHKTLGQKIKSLEQQRILPLLRAWMELEKQRKPFNVMHSEATRSIQLADLPIKIRYDRVDQLDDGKIFIIDYKTGKLELRHWAGDRPDEPQVPIYCIANQQKVSGAAIGQINIDEVSFKGLGEDSDIAPGLSSPELLTRLDLPDTWQEILQHWHKVLETLAGEFIHGAAQVEPKNINTSCQYCALHSLCRINEEIEAGVRDE